MVDTENREQHSNSTTLKDILDEVKSLSGSVDFTLLHESGDTLGNTSSCTVEPKCAPSNTDACK